MANKWKYSVLCLGLVLGLYSASGVAAANSDQATTPSVVMVCEHGTVKSLIAAKLFDQEASQRGLALRAVSRGMHPDEAVPAKIAKALENDGFDISGFDPEKLSKPDVTGSLRVVAIGADLAATGDGAPSPILRWDDVPPASVDYEASKASLLAHIQALLDELEKQDNQE
ncbi:MAG: hypothetical protein K0U98_23330 [Deltaproteobacteria bacterium]|nr:hypothetical protein [Deltaproteobacteria bacterium]